MLYYMLYVYIYIYILFKHGSASEASEFLDWVFGTAPASDSIII